MTTQEVQLYTDGAARGNPGPAGLGAVAIQGGNEVFRTYRYAGDKTNNEAEYLALEMGLQALIDAGLQQSRIRIFADSELMVKQINGAYKVKSETLKPYFGAVIDLLSTFSDWEIAHVRRADNTIADALANLAIDEFNQPPVSGSNTPQMTVAESLEIIGACITGDHQAEQALAVLKQHLK